MKPAKITMKEHARLIVRGLQMYAGFPMPLLGAKLCSKLFGTVLPFVNLYFSAQILNELAGTRDKSRLAFLVLLTIGLGLLGSITKSLLARWENKCDSLTWETMFKLLSDKLLSLDYIDLENPGIRQQHSEIRQHLGGMGMGFWKLLREIEKILTGLIQVVLSAVLAFSLFARPVPAGSPLAFLDSPAGLAGVFGAILCAVLLPSYLFMQSSRVWAKMSEDNNQGNRRFFFYFFELLKDSRRAKDIRIYNQLPIITAGAEWWKDVALFRQIPGQSGRFRAAGTVVSRLANGALFLYVALKAAAGAFAVGGVVQYAGALQRLCGGMTEILSAFGALLENNVYLEKTFAFLDIENTKYQGTLSVEKRDDNEYAIEFHNVSFRYPGNTEDALKNLNLKLQIGRKMAVVGMNGSGKTTMIKLLCRLYDPTEGEITLNGIDIKKYNYDEYMALFSVVFQDFTLMPFTLAQNVAANVAFDEKRLSDSLEKAGFSGRLAALPKGVDTWLYKNFEEDGVEPSGGEAQKIALARAIYRNAPFIVLDEPTAALDPVAEYEVYAGFDRISGAKTAVYISHRLASCRFCEEILVFHEGRAVQQGSHEALLEDSNGIYYALWHAQAQYYQEKNG